MSTPIDQLLAHLKPKNSTFVVVDGESSLYLYYKLLLTHESSRPQHLLVPRGQAAGGQEFQLFVMVSDYELDKIDQDLVGTCNQAAAFCGIRDRKYPDRRPMGYPFDRVPRTGVDTLNSFLTPNMKAQDVRVVFTDTVRPRP